MKKQIIFLFAVIVAGTTIANAQGGQRMSIEDRVARVHVKIDSAFKLDAAKLEQVDSIFARYYRAQQEKMAPYMNNGGERPDRAKMMEEMKPLTDARDERLKTVLTEAQFKTFKDEIELALRPGGGRGGNGGGKGPGN